MDIVKNGFLVSSNAMNLLKKTNLLTVILTSTLVACGGSSGGSRLDNSTAWKEGVFADESQFANRCAMPRDGSSPVTGIPYPDRKGSTRDENNFLRSWSNDTYLWYDEIVDRNPANYNDPLVYFDLLKTTAKTNTGADKDKFHFTYDTATWEALSESGITYGYGMQFAFISMEPPRELIVAYTEPGSPAALANIPRGTKIVEVDGVDLVFDNTDSGIDTLNNGLFPSVVGQAHTFGIVKPGEDTIEDVVLTSASVTSTPVQNVKTIETETGTVGYLAFHDHIATAELGLVNAISQLQDESITDLIIDLRYNGGGYLAIASQLAYMVAGNTNTQGEIFETMEFNDKHPTRNPVTGETLSPDPFYNIGLGFSVSQGQALPSLNLSRVFVLTGGDTCSASESFMNGLRGIGVEVIQIGDTTCGKPYGFYPEDNCGTTYFTVQFRGANAEGFGDYTDGFVPSATDNNMANIRGCRIEDDFNHLLGDEDEARLAAALYFRENNSCPPAMASSSDAAMKAGAVSIRQSVMVKPLALKVGWKKK